MRLENRGATPPFPHMHLCHYAELSTGTSLPFSFQIHFYQLSKIRFIIQLVHNIKYRSHWNLKYSFETFLNTMGVKQPEWSRPFTSI